MLILRKRPLLPNAEKSQISFNSLLLVLSFLPVEFHDVFTEATQNDRLKLLLAQ